MPSSYTTSLRLTLPATGELAGQWGNTVNTGITELLDAAVAGTTTISTWGGAGVSYTLSNNSGSADEARRMFIVATGTPGEAKNVICPAVSKFYVFRNDTTGGFALTLKTPSGTGVSVPAGQYRFLYCDGTNVVEMFNSVASLRLSSLTSGRVTYAGSAGLLQDSANLTFNGTDLTVSGAVNAGSINATTLDLTNIEVTNIKAKDGTASASIADSTGAFSVSAAFAANGNTTLGDAVGDLVTVNGTTTFANANPTLSAGTANGVLYLNGSKVATSGSALTFDGTKLSVSAGVAPFFAQNTAGTYAIDIKGGAGASNVRLGDAGDAFVVNVSGGEQLRLTSTGLGIGTTATTKLDVAGSVTAQQQTGRYFGFGTGTFSFDSTTVTDYGVSYTQPGATFNTVLSGFTSIKFTTNRTEAMRLDASGNLGIGTSSPTQRLDVNGRGIFTVADNTYATAFNATTGNLRITPYESSVYSSTALVAYSAGYAGYGPLTVDALNHRWWVSGTEGMRLTSTGLGIGTSSPGGLLGVNGATVIGNQATTGTDGSIRLITAGGVNYIQSGQNRTTASAAPLAFTDMNGSSEWMRLSSTGNLGIGTSSPGYKLSVVGTSGSAVLNLLETGVRSWGIRAGGAVTNTFDIADFTAGQTRLTIDSSGNLGLGTAPNSVYRLKVNGGAEFLDTGPGVSWGPWTSIQENGFFDAGGNFLHNAIKTSGANDTWTYRNNGFATRYKQLNSVHSWYTAPSGTAGNAISFTQAMTLDASGNLGIGTTSPSSFGKFAVTGSLGTTYINDQGVALVMTRAGENYINAANGNLNYNAGTHVWTNSAQTTEYARITSGGNLLVGTQTDSGYHRLNRSNTSDWVVAFTNAAATTPWGVVLNYSAAAPNNTSPAISFSDTGGERATIRNNGGIANYQGNDVNLSDRREKTNFAPAKSYLDTICAIPVQTFEYIDQSPDDPGLTLGVVAQDVQAVAPELVMESNWGTEDNPKMRLSIYQTDLQYALMKCIQELKAQNDELRARVAALESQP